MILVETLGKCGCTTFFNNEPLTIKGIFYR
jgi:hypothetical protein